LPFEFSGEQEKKVQTSVDQKANAHHPIYPLPPLQPMGKERCSLVDAFGAQLLHKTGAVCEAHFTHFMGGRIEGTVRVSRHHVLHMRDVQCMTFASQRAEGIIVDLRDLRFWKICLSA
jgi:hypothetical protein